MNGAMGIATIISPAVQRIHIDVNRGAPQRLRSHLQQCELPCLTALLTQDTSIALEFILLVFIDVTPNLYDAKSLGAKLCLSVFIQASNLIGDVVDSLRR